MMTNVDNPVLVDLSLMCSHCLRMQGARGLLD